MRLYLGATGPHLLPTLLVALAGCATLPQDPVERALYGDLRHIVDTEERLGWLIDDYEIAEATPSALQSVCQVAVEQRMGLLDWLDARIAEEGGSAEQVYEAAGKDLSAAEELLTLERIQALLERADAEAGDKCPFFLEPDPDFRGMQADAERFVLLAESGGGFGIVLQGRDLLLGGGGGLRVMPGYGFSDRFGAFVGIELGGNGAISPTEDDGAQRFLARPSGAVPLLLRFYDNTWIYDVELAAIAEYYDSTVTLPGFRISGGVGIGAVRIGSFMPFAVGTLAYEIMPPFRDLPLTHTFKLGTRVGLNIDP
ncbi:MAG: hypothetical protein R3B72_36885 [Polyangiaceae bacterium]